jgi:signal transduction histidine kinase
MFSGKVILTVIISAALLALLALFFSTLILDIWGTGTPDPISTITETWAEVEDLLSEWIEQGEQEGQVKAEFRKLLNKLDSSLAGFSSGPIYASLVLTSFSPEKNIINIQRDLEELEGAINSGRKDRAFILSSRLQKEINQLLILNGKTSDAIHMNYFYIFYIFVAVLLIVVLAMWRLNQALGSSLNRERQRAAFSRQMVLAQERERSRIARELHDTVAQDIRGLGLQISRISRLVKEEQGEISPELGTLWEETSRNQETILARIRSVCTGLIPPDFLHQGFEDTLRRFCGEFGKRTGIECRVSIQEGLVLNPLEPEMRLQCFRLIQEALANIEKHSGAREATVLVRNNFTNEPGPEGLKARSVPEAQSLIICVSDDGRGFSNIPTRLDTGNGLGIRGMYERVDILGGSLKFISEKGEGTMVQIIAPLVP